MDPTVVRMLEPGDLPAVEVHLAAKRARYETLSPRFWRAASEATVLHELFLQWLVVDDSTLCLTTPELDGVLIATSKEGGWLIDDFAVATPGRWKSVGSALLADARRQLGSTVSVVCASRDDEQRAVLDEAGMTPYETWWVGDTDLVAGRSSVRVGSTQAEATIGPAPPVYDPGGQVALVTSWDGDPAALTSLASTIRSQCVLVVVPVAGGDEERELTVETLGFEVASVWYR